MGNTHARSLRRGGDGEQERDGFTLVELLLAAAVLVVAVYAISRAIVSGAALIQDNHETAVAHQAARRAMGALQAAEFLEIFQSYNADPADDPGGPGTQPGNTFAVPGLDPRDDDPDGFVGEVIFPSFSPDGVSFELREDLDDPVLGMPRDLNGDGDVDALDHADDYLVLPVTLRLSWKGVSGERTYEVSSLLFP